MGPLNAEQTDWAVQFYVGSIVVALILGFVLGGLVVMVV